MNDETVVLGASAAGMIAAAALVRRGKRVTLVDRDALDRPFRKGVPQAEHAHNLTPRGLRELERLLPGLTSSLAARGASVTDLGLGGRWVLGGHALMPVETGHTFVLVARPVLDACLRERLVATGRVTWLERTDVVGLAGDRDRIDGVRLYGRDEGSREQTLHTGLVVDAMGRGSRVPGWLEAMGVSAAPVESLDVGVTYATRWYRRSRATGPRFFVFTPGPTERRGGVAFAVDDERWVVTLFGYGERPSIEDAAFRAWAASLSSREIGKLVERESPLGHDARFVYPRALRHRLDQRTDAPAGLVSFGDALMSTNPTWGLGITAAALSSVAFDALETPRAFHAAALAGCADVWRMTTTNDLRLDAVTGQPPAIGRWLVALTARVIAGGARDPVLARTFFDMLAHEASPTALFAPRVLARLLRPHRGAGTPDPASGTLAL